MNHLDLAARAAAIELLVLDVDGVLTDGSVIYADDGSELKRFHVRDGSGLKLWRAAGKRAAIISGRKSVAVERRAAELGVAPVLQGRDDKPAALAEVLAATGLRAEQACAIGDDLPDVGLFQNCGLAIAVADACTEARAAAHYVTAVHGGRGAVRDAIEWLLKLTGRWDELTAR
ncbi:MAG: phenylphosphate carboxylase subunit delta [Planctomycetes bacterium]|nr:phenylphosphate carboxylase subunit delta [Planctomycetota bacterium]